MKVNVKCWWLLFLVFLAAACSGSPTADLTTDTKSTALVTEAEQIQFLSQYVTLKSAVTATEFHIIYHDNSGGLLPGPSDWNIQAVMQVEDVAPWIEGKTQLDSADFTWADSFLTDELRPTSQSTYYTSQTTTIAVFAPELIIYLHSTTTP
jgi:hypothetical protein